MSNTKYSNILTEPKLKELISKYRSVNKISEALDIPIPTIIRYLDKFDIPRTKITKYPKNENVFETDNETSFYLAGFIAADGCIDRENKRLSIDLAIKDKDHLAKIIEIITPGKPYSIGMSSIVAGQRYKVCRYTVYSTKLINDLKRFNIEPHKSLVYEFPKWMIEHPLVHHFLRGYFDGDGCWTIHSPQKSPRRTLERVPQLIFKLLGTEHFLSVYLDLLKARITCITDTKTILKIKDKKHFALEFGGNNVARAIFDLLYDNASLYLERKCKMANDHLVSIEKLSPNIFASS